MHPGGSPSHLLCTPSPTPINEEKPGEGLFHSQTGKLSPRGGHKAQDFQTGNSRLPLPLCPRPSPGRWGVVFPLGAKLPHVHCRPLGSKGIWFLELSHVPGPSPLGLQVSRALQRDPSFLAAPRPGKGQGAAWTIWAPADPEKDYQVSALFFLFQKGSDLGLPPPPLRNWVLAASWVWDDTRE